MKERKYERTRYGITHGDKMIKYAKGELDRVNIKMRCTDSALHNKGVEKLNELFPERSIVSSEEYLEETSDEEIRNNINGIDVIEYMRHSDVGTAVKHIKEKLTSKKSPLQHIIREFFSKNSNSGFFSTETYFLHNDISDKMRNRSCESGMSHSDWSACAYMDYNPLCRQPENTPLLEKHTHAEEIWLTDDYEDLLHPISYDNMILKDSYVVRKCFKDIVLGAPMVRLEPEIVIWRVGD